MRAIFYIHIFTYALYSFRSEERQKGVADENRKEKLLNAGQYTGMANSGVGRPSSTGRSRGKIIWSLTKISDKVYLEITKKKQKKKKKRIK